MVALDEMLTRDLFAAANLVNNLLIKTKLLLHKRKLYLIYGMVLCLVTLIDL